ncbi:MAG: DUF4252 domain-containing protein [Bryobacteraceae bacterium]
MINLIPLLFLFQDVQFPDWDRLAAKATEKVEVTLDGAMLNLSAGFLSADKPDEARIKKMIGDLKGIFVRSLTFAKEGEYSAADVDKIREQLKPPAWNRIVDVRGKSDNAGVYLKTDGKQIQGLVVIAAEPKELTIVNIVGIIDPALMKELGGKLGIPNIDLERKRKKDD